MQTTVLSASQSRNLTKKSRSLSMRRSVANFFLAVALVSVAVVVFSAFIAENEKLTAVAAVCAIGCMAPEMLLMPISKKGGEL